MQLSSSKIKEICDLYQGGLSSREIAQKMGISHTAVLYHLKQNNIERRSRGAYRRLTEKTIEEICQLYTSGLSINDVANKLGISFYAVRKYLCLNNIKRRPSGGQQRYALNEGFFKEINTPTKAYWLGFLMADGNVKRNLQSYRVKITLSSIDKEHLIKFKDALNSDVPIRMLPESKIDDEYVSKPKSEIVIYSSKLALDLIRHGCVEKKSLILKFPSTVPNKLLNHFLRGYFDGDGSLWLDKQNNQWRWGIAGTLKFLQEAQKILRNNCGVQETKIRQHNKIFILQYSGNQQIKRILDWLYKDSKPEIRLERKYKLYLQLGD